MGCLVGLRPCSRSGAGPQSWLQLLRVSTAPSTAWGSHTPPWLVPGPVREVQRGLPSTAAQGAGSRCGRHWGAQDTGRGMPGKAVACSRPGEGSWVCAECAQASWPGAASSRLESEASGGAPWGGRGLQFLEGTLHRRLPNVSVGLCQGRPPPSREAWTRPLRGHWLLVPWGPWV